MSPALAGGFLTTEPPGKPIVTLLSKKKKEKGINFKSLLVWALFSFSMK